MLVAAIVTAGLLVWSGAPADDGAIRVAGSVRSEIRVVTAPARSGGATMPAVAGLLATVDVAVGDRVDSGQVIATLDTALLDLGVDKARAAEAEARAKVGVLDAGLDDIEDRRAELADAKGDVADARAKLTKAHSELKATRAKLVASKAAALEGRADLQARIATLERLIGSGNATSTPPAPTPQQTLAALRAKLVEVEKGIVKLDAGIAKVDSGLAEVAKGSRKLSSAAGQVATGESALKDARAQLTTAREVTAIVAQGRSLGIRAAEIARDASVITAPVTGTVTFARTAGTVAMVGAPIVRIRPDDLPAVDTYLTAEQVREVSSGDPVELTLDSFPERIVRGNVSALGTRYRYPPNTFPTELTHMTLVVPVTVTFPPDSALPPGTPVDLVIRTTPAKRGER